MSLFLGIKRIERAISEVVLNTSKIAFLRSHISNTLVQPIKHELKNSRVYLIFCKFFFQVFLSFNKLFSRTFSHVAPLISYLTTSVPKQSKSAGAHDKNMDLLIRGLYPMIVRKGFSIAMIAAMSFVGCDSHQNASGGGATQSEDLVGTIGQGEVEGIDAAQSGSTTPTGGNESNPGEIAQNDGSTDTGSVSGEEQDKPYDPDNEDLGKTVLDLPSGLSLRNYRELEATLLSISGFSDWPAETQVVLEDVNPLLPRGFEPSQYGGTVQQAVTKLTHSLASQMVIDADVRERFFGTTDLTGAPATVYAAGSRSDIFTAILDEIGRGTVLDKNQQMASLDALVTDLLSENLNSTDISVALLVQVMSSTDVLFEM